MIVIHDTEGKIISVRNSEDWKPAGVPYIIVEPKEGYSITGVDMSGENPSPVWMKNPEEKTTKEALEEVSQQLSMLTDCILEMSETIYA